MRVLIDYRRGAPRAERRRRIHTPAGAVAADGVSHEGATGRARPDAVLELMERSPASPSAELAGARRSIAAFRSRCSTSPGTGSSGRPIEHADRPLVRRRALAAPAADCRPARAAQVVTIHDLNFLLHPERTRAEIRRDYPALAARTRRTAPTASSCVSQFTAGEVERLLAGAAPTASPSARLAHRPGRRGRAQPSDGYVLFFGTLEPRKNVGAPARRLRSAGSRRRRATCAAAGTGRARPPSSPASWLERIDRAPLHRTGHAHRLRRPRRERRALYAGARLLVQPSFDEGFGLPVLEAMTARRAGGRRQPRRPAGSARRRGHAGRPDRPDAIAAADLAPASTTIALAADVRRHGARPRADFSWANTAQATLRRLRRGHRAPAHRDGGAT